MTLCLTKSFYFRTKNSSLRPFFSQFVHFHHIHPITVHLEILGATAAWAVPTSNFLGTVPLSLRPWGTSFFTSAASHQRGCRKDSSWVAQVWLAEGERRQIIR